MAAALALALFGLCGIIRLIAGDAGGWQRAMAHYAPPERTGLPADDYPDMAEMIASYLSGARERFQYTAVGVDGESLPCFGEREIAHMADCRALIRLAGIVCALSGAAAAVLIFFQARAAGRRENLNHAFGRGGLTGLGIVGVIAGALLVWAAADFDGLFLAFHRVAFRNDLWLLDPRTDLLIRLMPQPLFVHLGMKGLLPAAGWMAALAVAFWFVATRQSGKERKET